MNTIHLFTNKKSQFGVLETFSNDLQKALKKKGIRSQTFDVLQEGVGDIIASFKKDPPECTFGFNMTISPDFFYDILDVPHVAIYVDTISYHSPLHTLTRIAPRYPKTFLTLKKSRTLQSLVCTIIL